jgi:competence protein ComEC
MQSWNPYPFIRLLIPFLIGIVSAIQINESFGLDRTNLLLMIVLFALVAGSVYFIKSFRFRYLPGAVVSLFMLVAGYNITLIRSAQLDPTSIINNPKTDGFVLVRVLEPVSEKARSVKVIAGIEKFADSIETARLNGKALIYLEKDSASLSLNYGDYLFLNNKLVPTQPPDNPHQFDYKRFLANSGIYHQAYLRAGEWKRLDKQRKNPLFGFAFSARKKMLQLLEINGLRGDEFAVVSAILLGYNENMDQELRQKYAGAGALHVLCVSGLHVGIIFFILSFLLKPLDKRKSFRYVKMALLLVSIWCFAFITGLSPSVMRASLMFSLFSWRESRKDKSNPYNIIAASALILLAIDPYIITKIGFQLSYSAVIAIIALFDPIYKLFAFRNFLADYFWKLAVVSIAAQLGTFPLAVHYFNQFPVYFLLTNIVVIPLVWLILNIGVAVFFTSVLSPIISTKISLALHYLLVALNGSVEFIHSLPGSTADGLVLSIVQVALFYVLIIFISRALIFRNGQTIIYSMVLLLLIGCTFVFGKIEIENQKIIVVYKLDGQTAIDVINGRNALMLADSTVLNDARLQDFNISGNRIQSGIKNIYRVNLNKSESFENNNKLPVLMLGETDFIAGTRKRLAIIKPGFVIRDTDQTLKVNYLLLRNNPDLDIAGLSSQFDFDVLIFDASNNFRNINHWSKQCDTMGINYHNIKNDGYFKAAF